MKVLKNPSGVSNVVSITLVLIVLGTLGLILSSAQKISNHLKENVEVAITLKSDSDSVAIQQLVQQLKSADYAKNVQYITKEQAAITLQKELGEIFQREGRNWFGQNFITITGVRVTTDLGLARIQLSMFKVAEPKLILKQLSIHKNEIRKALGLRIGKQARIIPELEFFHDDTLDYVEKIENIFKNLNIPPEEK